MSISLKLRFEILKRDNWTCQYCGRRAPEVELHLDHQYPVSVERCDDPSNIVTACTDCNMGKRAELLCDVSPEFRRATIQYLHELLHWRERVGMADGSLRKDT